MPTASVNGIDVYYERGGEGRPVLFLNGSGSTLATSAIVIAPFRERFDLVAHDQRGLGRTSIPPGPYSMADYAADAVGLLDAVGWDRCRVVGISFGGMVGAGAGGHLARAHRAPGPALHLARRRGRGVVPAPRAGRSGRRGPCREGGHAARHPVHRRVARHPRLGPDDRRDDGGASFDPAHRRGAPRGARAAAGAPPPRRVGPPRPDQLPDPRRRRSLRRHRARPPTRRASRVASPARSSGSTRAATPSSARIRRRCPRCWTSSTR